MQPSFRHLACAGMLIGLMQVSGLARGAPAGTPPVSGVAKPLPPEAEWWQTAGDNGKRRPVLTDPWWDKTSSSATAIDRATDLWWKNPATLPDTSAMSYAAAQSVCGRYGPGSRLPTRLEISTILDRYRSKPVVDPSVFPGIVSDFYWTMTSSSPGSNWQVHLDDGRFIERSTATGSVGRVFCVSAMRESAQPPHYTASAGSIRDNATGLHWQGAVTTANDLQALATACAGSTIAGFQWRIPTIKELQSLMALDRPRPYLDPVFSDGRELVSSTAADGFGGLRFQAISFQTGARLDMEETATRCVSGGSPKSPSSDRIHKGRVEILDGYENGNLALQDFEGRHLLAIQGDVLIQGTDSSALILPYLETIEGNLTITDTRFEEIHLPNLSKVTGSIIIVGNGALRKLSMRSLVAVGGDLTVSKNPRLGIDDPDDDAGTGASAVRLGVLQAIDGTLSVEYNDRLKTLYLPRLETVGRQVLVTQNNQLWWVQTRGLQAIGRRCAAGDRPCGALDVGLNLKLSALSMDRLEEAGGDVLLQGNPVLSDFSNRLVKIGLGLTVRTNRGLCAKTQIDPILYRMWAKGRFPGSVEINGNDPAQTCRTACPDLQGNHCSVLGSSRAGSRSRAVKSARLAKIPQ